MKPVMKVTVTQASGKYRGWVQLPNLVSTYLEKENGDTGYTTVSNLRQAATAVAKKYNTTLNFVVPCKLAAKRSAR